MISVVIPVYRSQHILPELCRRLEGALGRLGEDYEVIFAVDCSPDRSFAVLKGLAAGDRRLKPILLRKNVGYDNAVMAGLNFVRGRLVVIMDDDLQHAPEDIPALLQACAAGSDVVYAGFPEKKQSWLKNAGSWVNDKVANIILQKPGSLYLSPFKAVGREVVDEIVKYSGPFPYIDGLIFQITSAITQIPIAHHERASGQGGHGLLRSLRIWLNFCTTFSILPLRASVCFGFLISAAAFLYSARVLIRRLAGGTAPEGWVSIVLGIAILGGIQLIALGILGEYIGRTYMNINRKPQFVVKDKVNIA
ncbi:MAG: glycosyltransferase family 2 protein [Elusimicrobia bacterium]|nr:glycosyltransferase family 2 protein [Elusimicrobiota bacterium]